MVTVLFSSVCVCVCEGGGGGAKKTTAKQQLSGHKGDIDLRNQCTFSWLSLERFIQNLSQKLYICPCRLTVPY